MPSEALPLTWGDVNWEKHTLHVKSPKTEHHAGQASRTVPLFPELHKVLLAAFEAAEPGGSPWIITRYRDPKQNQRTQFERIILRAGLTPWPKPWHNMRASRQSELMAKHDLASACRWLGNSPAVAAKHYAMVMNDGSFERAIGAAQNTAQSMAESDCTRLQAENGDSEKSLVLQACADICSNVHKVDMGAAGFEPAKA